MFDLKRGGGSFKGIIGECMFKLTNKNVVITKFFNKNKYMAVFRRHFTPIQQEFLFENWHSLDAIDIIFETGIKRIILYEIKTRNKYEQELHHKPKMTLETHHLYNQAKELGFITKIATVWLLNDWKYDLEIKDFDEKDYYIDSPKLYDKRARG